MNIDNDQIFSSDIDALRAENGRPQAKAELILKLTQTKGKKMTTLRKATLPTLITAVALVGGVFLTQPKVIAATPSRVADALKKAMNYTIKSFVGEGSERRMQSMTTVEGDKKTTKYVDAKGNLVDKDVHFKTLMGNDGKIRVEGKSLGEGMTFVPNGSKVVKGEKIEVNVKKANGKEVRTIKVNGKEVKELPKELQDKIKVTTGGSGAKVVAGMGIIGDLPEDTHFVSSNKVMAITSLGTKNGKPMILQSGQTPSEYLVDLLVDESRWNITRGVTYNGAKLDKFGLKVKGDFTPVELYVDPATALPKYLVFKGMDGMGMKIEDVYEYGVQP